MDYHQDRFRDVSLMIYCHDRLVALFPACIRNDDVVSSHEGLSYGGLLVRTEEYSDQTIRYLAAVLKYYHESGFDRLVLRQMPAFYATVPCDEMNYALFLAGASVFRVNLNSAIDLGNRLPLQRRRKTGIRTAEQNEIEVVETSDFQEFWSSILIPNLELRHSAAPVHTVDEIRSLCEANKGRIRQFNALHKGRIMAGCTIFDVGRVAKVQYFSGCDEGRANGSLDYLVYRLISEFFKDKNYLDFGNSNTENGMRINHGLLSWKEGFGARSYVQKFFDVETGNHYRISEVFA
ncbi:MAG: GNAT family N-acetyltransferase [Chlorobiaceae bacterium]|nr:GNAT family N-acetyltransferase [Chlorobiaceae bacterium]NTW73723.1 GNAT family N-acetyltransferase [Chlorobiaceae bacterium]